ncbi:hypothetical protein C8Q77DRAFT_862098 [Trametes polyzona]|nr:hypothetical protein C8Q77DRAFT_862098 [Trametes polyzona]
MACSCSCPLLTWKRLSGRSGTVHHTIRLVSIASCVHAGGRGSVGRCPRRPMRRLCPSRVLLELCTTRMHACRTEGETDAPLRIATFYAGIELGPEEPRALADSSAKSRPPAQPLLPSRPATQNEGEAVCKVVRDRPRQQRTTGSDAGRASLPMARLSRGDLTAQWVFSSFIIPLCWRTRRPRVDAASDLCSSPRFLILPDSSFSPPSASRLLPSCLDALPFGRRWCVGWEGLGVRGSEGLSVGGPKVEGRVGVRCGLGC